VTSHPEDGRKRRAGSEPPPRLAPSIRSGLVSGDGIVAAGRKQVFSRVAETRALAAQASRARAARVRPVPAVLCGGSTTSAGSPPMRNTSALVVVRKIFFFYELADPN
jgi:phosphopantothenate synthetase